MIDSTDWQQCDFISIGLNLLTLHKSNDGTLLLFRFISEKEHIESMGAAPSIALKLMAGTGYFYSEAVTSDDPSITYKIRVAK